MSFPPGVTEGLVTVDGVSVRYYDSDPSDPRLPLVLLHGTGGTAHGSFWALFPMLSFRHRVITLDFVDEVPLGSGALAVGHFVEQARAVIRHRVPDGPVALIGYSLGAVVAAQLAAECPELVDSLTLVAGWITTDPQQELRNALWQQLKSTAPDALGAFMTLTAFSAGFLASKSGAEIAALVQTAQDGPDRSLKMALNRVVDISDRVGRIRARTLVVGCTHDQMVPLRHSQALFGAIDTARFAQIDSGHAVVHERPAELFTLIDTFVSGSPYERSGTVLETVHS